MGRGWIWLMALTLMSVGVGLGYDVTYWGPIPTIAVLLLPSLGAASARWWKASDATERRSRLVPVLLLSACEALELVLFVPESPWWAG